MSLLLELTDELNAFNATFKDKAKASIDATFKVFFGKFPEVSHVKWHQYAPYFNDGDACVFRVRDVYVFLTNEAREKFGIEIVEDDEDEEGDMYSLGSGYGEGRKYISPRAQEIYEAVEEISKGLNGIEPFLEDIYGDSVEIKKYQDGTTEVEEYEHDLR